MMAFLIGLTILADSKKWWCDGTFKTYPKFYYQHYIIQGKFKNSRSLPDVFSFLSGKTFELYNIMLTQLKFLSILVIGWHICDDIFWKYLDKRELPLRSFSIEFIRYLIISHQKHIRNIESQNKRQNSKFGLKCV